jgi:hypothetical protein
VLAGGSANLLLVARDRDDPAMLFELTALERAPADDAEGDGK